MNEFNFVLDRKNDHAVALKNRGFCQLQVGNLNDAINDLGKAIRTRPGDGDAYFLRGIALLKANQPVQALIDFRQSLELSSEPDVELHYYLAAALEQSGKFTEAIEQYDTAIELDSNHFASRLNRCILLADQGQADLAFEDASVALSINPQHAIAVNSRGAANVLRGKLDEAQADFDLAIELAPDYAEAWFNRALLQSRQQRYRGAIDDFTQAIKQDPDSIEFYLGRAKARLQVGEFTKAKSDLNLILDRDPKHDEATRLQEVLPREK
jgi:tetratricopeptide (TPR) repeat protein